MQRYFGRALAHLRINMGVYILRDFLKVNNTIGGNRQMRLVEIVKMRLVEIVKMRLVIIVKCDW